MRRTGLIVACILCAVWGLEAIGLFVFMSSQGKPTEDNTTEFVATVDYVQVTGTGEIGDGSVVSLKTEEREIFSLTDYNQYFYESDLPPKITLSVMALILLFLAVHCALLLRGINIFHRRKNNKCTEHREQIGKSDDRSAYVGAPRSTNTKGKKQPIALFIISLLLFLMIVVIEIVAKVTVSDYSETNTTEFAATVKDVEGDILYTKEYGAELYLLADSEYIDWDEFRSLQSGQNVYFRIENVWLKQFETMDFCHIVSLRTDEKEIFSLDMANKCRGGERKNDDIIGIVFGTAFLAIMVYCIVQFVRLGKLRKSYTNVTGRVTYISYSDDLTALYYEFTDLNLQFDEACFKVSGRNLSVAKRNGIDQKIKIGDTVSFTVMPKEFGDGYGMPIVAIAVNGEETLRFKEGYANL